MAASQLENLPPVLSRRVAAVVGACVADAAAMPLHWIYQQSKMESLTANKEEIEFRVPSANPFYRLETGRNTCYSEQAYVMLKSLVESKGLNVPHLIDATYNFFGPDSEYESKDNDSYKVGKEDKINIRKTFPILGPWRHGCLREFIKNVQENKTPPGGSKDDQIDVAIRLIPLVALYAGHPDMLKNVEAGLRVLQESDMAIASGLAAARILEQYILHGDPDDPLQYTVDALSSSDNENSQELDKAVADLPTSLQSTLHGLVTARSYVEGVRSTMLVGGCNASRAGFIGACMAAKEGFDTIPESWRNRTHRYEEVLDLAKQLIKIEV
ncbi:selenoprotein J [Elysia marginata]|uniref:Selenoprotein J n=1 Tax=Elysia marginata TaxID=1093978 RepID=A0AAV4IL68_9GAST|nr:selenoprotein J [Elysia marginata]